MRLIDDAPLQEASTQQPCPLTRSAWASRPFVAVWTLWSPGTRELIQPHLSWNFDHSALAEYRVGLMAGLTASGTRWQHLRPTTKTATGWHEPVRLRNRRPIRGGAQ